MKKRSKFFINIATIVLCLGVVLFGVYAVSKKATLNINGTVGLIVHDCAVKVSGTIEGDAVKTTYDEDNNPIYSIHYDGYASPERKLFDTVFLREENHSKVINLPETHYFTDLTEDGKPARIIIKFEIQNVSTFKITAELFQPTLEGGNQTADENGEYTGIVGFSARTAIEAGLESTVSSKIKLDPEEVGYLYVFYDLDPTTVNGQVDYITLNELANFDTMVEFRKFNRIEDHSKIELGTFNGETINWIPLCSYNKDGNPISFSPSNYYEIIVDGEIKKVKKFAYIMEDVYEYYSFCTCGFHAGDSKYKYENSEIRKYVTSDEFKEKYGLYSADFEYYGIGSLDLATYNEVVWLYDTKAIDAHTGEYTEWWITNTMYWGMIHLWYAYYIQPDGYLNNKNIQESNSSGVRPKIVITIIE